MRQEEFENQLRKKIFKRRLISGFIAGAFLLLLAVFGILQDVTKEVIYHEGYFGLIPGWEEVKYNEGYIVAMIICLVGFIYPVVFLLVDCLLSGYRTVQKDLHTITVYRGILHNIVYVDGQEMARTKPGSGTHVAEAHLPNGVRVTVSFGRGIWCLAHISYSDHTPSVEV